MSKPPSSKKQLEWDENFRKQTIPAHPRKKSNTGMDRDKITLPADLQNVLARIVSWS